MFDERGYTEVELRLAYYTFHERGFGQGGGAAWPSHTEHRQQKNYPRGKRTFSLTLRMGGLNIALPQDLHQNLEQSIELSNPLASFNNDSFEFQQCESEQPRSVSDRKQTCYVNSSNKIHNRKHSARNEVYHPAGFGERSI